MRDLASVLALAALTMAATVAAADISPHMSYQGVLRDSVGNVVPDGSYDITFTLYEDAGGVVDVWTEDQTVDVEGGVFDVLLGTDTPLSTVSWEVPY